MGGEGGGGGWVTGEGTAPLDLLSQTNQVCGWILSFFRLSYFDCCLLCLAIVCHFHGREIGWSTVCANSKQKAS